MEDPDPDPDPDIAAGVGGLGGGMFTGAGPLPGRIKLGFGCGAMGFGLIICLGGGAAGGCLGGAAGVGVP